MAKKLGLRSLLTKLPSNSYFRKKFNKQMLDVCRSRYVDPLEAARAEADPALKEELIQRYMEQFPAVAKVYAEEVDRQIQRTPCYQERKDDPELRREMLFCRFAYGFQPDEFLCYELEHKSRAERLAYVSDRDLMCYVYRMNDRIDYSIFNDKAKTYEFFRAYYGREVISISTEGDYAKFCDFVEKHPVFVKKNVAEAMGRSIARIDIADCGKTPRELFDQLIKAGKHVLEECVVQSETFAAFNSSSVNTIRCITYYTKDGVIVPFCFMKVGRAGAFVDNGGAGGILVGIDIMTGRLNTDGFDEFKNRYVCHPDSGKVFNGCQLPDVDQAIDMSKEMSAKIPSVKFIGWDLAHTPKGWVVIEGNGMSQLIGPQIVFERGVKEEIDEIARNMKLIID